jgi:hypothetical protein
MALTVTSGFWPLIKAGKSCLTSAALREQYGPGAQLNVQLEVSALGDSTSQDPHFSACGEVSNAESRKRRNRDDQVIACGCMHDVILAAWPEAAPLVALHLSSARTGEPMHAEANGFYWLAGALNGLDERYHGGSGEGGKGPEDCLRIFAEHVRVPIDAARELAATLAAGTRWPCPSCYTSLLDAAGLPCVLCKGDGLETLGRMIRRSWWSTVVADMRPRWQREALDGLRFMRDHAYPSDGVNEWTKRVRDVLGVDLSTL